MPSMLDISKFLPSRPIFSPLSDVVGFRKSTGIWSVPWTEIIQFVLYTQVFLVGACKIDTQYTRISSKPTAAESYRSSRIPYALSITTPLYVPEHGPNKCISNSTEHEKSRSKIKQIKCINPFENDPISGTLLISLNFFCIFLFLVFKHFYIKRFLGFDEFQNRTDFSL